MWWLCLCDHLYIHIISWNHQDFLYRNPNRNCNHLTYLFHEMAHLYSTRIPNSKFEPSNYLNETGPKPSCPLHTNRSKLSLILICIRTKCGIQMLQVKWLIWSASLGCWIWPKISLFVSFSLVCGWGLEGGCMYRTPIGQPFPLNLFHNFFQGQISFTIFFTNMATKPVWKQVSVHYFFHYFVHYFFLPSFPFTIFFTNFGSEI